MAQLDDVLQALDDGREAALERLFQLLRIKSVSTDPAFAAGCLEAAQWLVKLLSELDFTASVRPTSGHPMVVAHAKCGRRGVPHVLFYGHYDVQPADPLGLWERPPFEPSLTDGPNPMIRARGAADDKGQLMTFLEACRAFHDRGGYPCDISILLEGEEETGSPSLPAFLDANKAELDADIMLVCDTGMWNATSPAITTSLRGMVYEEVTIRAADRDLHSGMFGGAAINPIRVLSRIIADLHDAQGRVTLPGFYEGVHELPASIAAQWRELGFDGAAYLANVGLSVPAGEQGRSVLEMIWSRPTAEVNGIYGGYTGQGSKTVLPAEASAKVSFRLVGTQDPDAVREAFHAFVKARLPADCRASFQSFSNAPALQLPFTSEALTRARRALAAEWGKEPVLIAMGGSIPIVGAFKRDLNMDALMIGFGLPDDRIHSPNEKYNLSSFQRGARSWARVLAELST